MTEREQHRERTARVTREVGEFYDRHPYPPPVAQLDDYRRSWDDPIARRADYHLYWPGHAYREERTILIAGCGTSQAAKHALRQPAARVVGIDLSTTSVQQTEALKKKYDLSNLEIHQLAIEHVRDLGRRFDQIVCTGTLHHLSEPRAGFCALRDVLAPDGALHVMVYATYGRIGIYMLQEYCRRLGVGTSEAEIHDLAHTLTALPQDHPLVPLLRAAPDFRTGAGLADALLHPCDQAFTVPQLFECLGESGLAFGRWLHQAPYLPTCGAPAGSPHGPRLTKLPETEQYAAMELFRGTMVRHSAIAYRDDRSGDPRPIRFDDERWLKFVPLRRPKTICVEEHAPLGASAVLINRSHTYPDLFLPIDSADKGLYDRIDGRRDVSEIIRGTRSSDGEQISIERARAFFERLWWYDQLVFDASSPEASAALAGGSGRMAATSSRADE